MSRKQIITITSVLVGALALLGLYSFGASQGWFAGDPEKGEVLADVRTEYRSPLRPETTSPTIVVAAVDGQVRPVSELDVGEDEAPPVLTVGFDYGHKGSAALLERADPDIESAVVDGKIIAQYLPAPLHTYDDLGDLAFAQSPATHMAIVSRVVAHYEPQKWLAVHEGMIEGIADKSEWGIGEYKTLFQEAGLSEQTANLALAATNDRTWVNYMRTMSVNARGSGMATIPSVFVDEATVSINVSEDVSNLVEHWLNESDNSAR